MARKIEVELVGDSRNLERAFARSARSAREFDRSMEKTDSSLKRGFAGAAAAIGAAGGLSILVDGLKSSVTAASNLGESMSKNRAVFGASAQQVEAWADTTARAFGVSERSALETASSFGALFAPLGLTGRTAADQSRKLTELGADLASFYNTDVQSALDAIKSGLVGEAEPLRRYGALLSETRVTEEALTETHKKNASQLTVQEKALARIELIFRDTAKAQGDFSRTSGGLAGQQKILTAQIDDLKAKLGEVLLPGVTEVVKKMNLWLASTENQDRLLGDLTTTVTTTTSLIYNLAAAVQTAANAYNNLNREIGRFEGFLDRIGVGINRQTLFRIVPGTEQIFEGVGALTAEHGGQTRPPKRPGGLLGSRFADAGSRAAGQPAAYSSMADAASRAIAAAIKADKVPPTPSGAAPKGASVTQRNAWFDAMISRQLGRVQDIPSLKGQVARLGVIAGLIRARMAVTKDVTRRLALEDQLMDVLRAQKATRSQRTAEIQALALDARTERLAWLDFAIEKAEDTKTLKDNRLALRAKEKFYANLVRHEKKNYEAVFELWRIRKQIRDLNKSQSGVDPLAGLMQVSTRKLTNMLAAGTGLGAAGRMQLGRNIAGTEIQPVYVGVQIDGREIGRAVTKNQARDRHRTNRQTSGFRG